jgi:hypothetical protein
MRDDELGFQRSMLKEQLTGYSQGETDKIDVDVLVNILVGLGATWVRENDADE